VRGGNATGENRCLMMGGIPEPGYCPGDGQCCHMVP
jgi:hypothetical protein